MPEIKLHLGCGFNRIDGWENHDLDIDLTKSLPFPDNSVRFVFAEHAIEHITSAEGLRFFKEAYRIIKPEGVIRLAFPDVERISQKYTTSYLSWLSVNGISEGTLFGAIDSITSKHAHKSLWTPSLMKTLLHAVGFCPVDSIVSSSTTAKELCGLEGHGKSVGFINNYIETSVVEGIK